MSRAPGLGTAAGGGFAGQTIDPISCWHVPKPYRRGQAMTAYRDGSCSGADFCQELSGHNDVTFVRVYQGNPPSRSIILTERFAVLVDLSPLTIGHLLLLPRAHLLSFAQVAAQRRDELNEFADAILKLYGRTFGPPVLLEHGSASDDEHNSCVTHAHWHIVPLAGDEIIDLMRSDGLRPTVMSDLAAAPWPSVSYYSVGYSSTLYLCRPPPTMPRQYVRSLIGRCLGLHDPEWDYSVIVRRQLLRQTLDLTSAWSRCIDSYPQWATPQGAQQPSA